MAINKAGMYASTTILLALATATVLARMRVRMVQNARFQIDDWTACAGLIVLWPIAGIIITGTAHNFFGTHTIQDPETGESSITRLDQKNVEYMWIVIILGILSIGLVKLSVVLLYRRIFKISRAFRIYSSILLILIAAWTVGFLAANIFQCGTHPAAAWTSTKLLLRYCDDTSTATTARALTNVVMDLMIVVSPMPIVWRLHLTVMQKVQISGIFALGFLAVAAGTVRAYLLLLDTLGPNRPGYRDLQGENTTVVAWTLIEIVAALVGCCLPTLRPLFADTPLGKIFGSIFSLISLRSRRSRSSGQDEDDGRLAFVSIGGREMKNPALSAKEDSACSLELHDVGRLA